MLVTRFFFFFQYVSYPIKGLSSANAFSLDQSKILLYGKALSSLHLKYNFAISLCSTKTNLPSYQPYPKQALVFKCLQYKSFENTEVQGEIAQYKQTCLRIAYTSGD